MPPLPTGVTHAGIDKVMFEIHPKKLGRDKTINLVSNLEGKGLFLRHDLIFGDVIAFERGTALPAIAGRELFAATLDFEERMAAQDLDAASRIAAGIAPALSGNAYFQFRLSQLERLLGGNGMAEAERGVDLGSEDFLLFASLASIYCNSGRYADAERTLLRLEQLYPRSPSIAPLRARIAAHANPAAA